MYLETDFEDALYEIEEPFASEHDDSIVEPEDDPTEVELMVLLSGMVSVIGTTHLH